MTEALWNHVMPSRYLRLRTAVAPAYCIARTTASGLTCEVAASRYLAADSKYLPASL